MAWLPISPYVSWPLFCLLFLVVVLVVLQTQLFPTMQSTSVKRLLTFFLLSFVVVVYEITGIIWGQRRSGWLKNMLPDLLGSNYQTPPITWDQRRIGVWTTMLPWEERLQRVWGSPGILMVAIAGLVVGFALTYAYFTTATGNRVAAFFVASWIGFSGFWGAPALFHLSSVTCFFHRLSSQSSKTVFMNPTGKGISEVGQLAFTYVLLYSGAAFMWVLVLLVTGFGRETVIIGAVMSAFAFFGLALPQLSIRWAMLRTKQRMLDTILEVIHSKYGAAPMVPGAELRYLMQLYGFVSALPPSGLFGAVVKSLGASVLPLSLTVLRAAADYFPKGTLLHSLVQHLR